MIAHDYPSYVLLVVFLIDVYVVVSDVVEKRRLPVFLGDFRKINEI